MKTTILFAAVLCCIQISASTLPEKSKVKTITAKTVTPPSFAFIRGHKQGANQTVTWGMTNNSGISSFIVECTYEDPTDIYSVWQTVGNIPSSNSPIFKFVDSPTLPGMLNYRITAVMNNTTVVSPIYSVYIGQ